MDSETTLRRLQGRRLKAAREQAGYRSARAAALDNEWPESTYRAHESGTRTIGQDDAERYTRRFRAEGAPIAAKNILFGGEDPKKATFYPPPDVMLVPRISGVSASQMADIGEVLYSDEAPKIPFGDLPPGDYFALRVEGDSMDRVAPDGAIILVNRRDRRLVRNKFYVFGHRGEATFKRYIDKPHKLLMPFSYNQKHEPIAPGRDFTTIGRVLRVLVDL